MSTSNPDSVACSGAMYSGVPTICRNSVNSVFCVSSALVAFAIPKSITFATGTPSCSVTSTFDGFRSRWITPFWCACCTAWHTCTNSRSRSRSPNCAASQYSVIGTPFTSSITKYGRPPSVAPPSRTLAMCGWSISASAWRSASKRATTCFVSIPSLMIFSATRRFTGSSCCAIHTVPKPPSPIASSNL